jgi:hypothetical protein
VKEALGGSSSSSALRKEVVRIWLWFGRDPGRLSLHQRVSDKVIANKFGESKKKAHKRHPQHI